MSRKKKIQPIRVYSETEAKEMANGLIRWLLESDQNFHIDDYLFVQQKIFKNDIDYLVQENPEFKLLLEQAEAIELAKLKKFAAADKLNTSIVKQILINKYNWL